MFVTKKMERVILDTTYNAFLDGGIEAKDLTKELAEDLMHIRKIKRCG